MTPPAPQGSQSPQVTVLCGPGPYAHHLLDGLTRLRYLRRAVHYYPEFVVEHVAGGRREVEVRDPLYHHAVRMMWGAWRRIPLLGRRETMRGPHFALFDRMASRYVDQGNLVVGWSQVSLHSLRRARTLGKRTLLEHPMSHVDTWMELLTQEYATHGRRGRDYLALFPATTVRRMHKEYVEADAISVLSSFAARSFLAAGIPPHKLIKVPLGVDAGRFHPGPRRSAAEPFRFLYVGRLELLKGIPYLLRAFDELRGQNAELWLAGTLYPEVQDLVRCHMGPRLRVLGHISPSELPAIYRQADALLFPTINDAFGLVVLEAMASGLPVITTENSVGGDVIEDGVQGYVVPIRSVEALKQRMNDLLADRGRERCQAMGAAGRERVLRGLTWGHYEERIGQAYRELLCRPDAPALRDAAAGTQRRAPLPA